jgi:hypothetical protein
LQQKLSIKKSAVIGLLMILMIMAGLPTNLFAQTAYSDNSLKVALLPILDSLPFVFP